MVAMRVLLVGRVRPSMSLGSDSSRASALSGVSELRPGFEADAAAGRGKRRRGRGRTETHRGCGSGCASPRRRAEGARADPGIASPVREGRRVPYVRSGAPARGAGSPFALGGRCARSGHGPGNLAVVHACCGIPELWWGAAWGLARTV